MPFFTTKLKYNKEVPRQMLPNTHKNGSSLHRAQFTPSAFASTRRTSTTSKQITSTDSFNVSASLSNTQRNAIWSWVSNQHRKLDDEDLPSGMLVLYWK
jgi:hypothetical protein